MSLDKNKINEILVISLSNIGDVILTFPVIDILKKDFPQANLSVVVGLKALSLVNHNPNFKEVYLYNKKDSWISQFKWILGLRNVKFDLIVDLRNTAIPLMLPHRYRTSLFKTKDKNIHMKEKHLARLKKVYPFEIVSDEKYALVASEKDKKKVDTFIESEMGGNKNFVIIAPGAANHDKRWSASSFKDLCDYIYKKYNCDIVFVGDENDKEVAFGIAKQIKSKSVNGCGKISLTQLAYLMKQCILVVANDSSPMHLASYLNVPIVAIFGPSNPMQYGPWSSNGSFLKRTIECPRCLNPKNMKKHICIDSKVEDVIKEVEKVLSK